MKEKVMFYVARFSKEQKQSDLIESLDICNTAIKLCDELNTDQFGHQKRLLKALLHFQ
jgi:hypothetical protein